MKIALGTTSKSKLEILEAYLHSSSLDEFQINPLDVDSEVTDQPLTEGITLEGVENRANNALNLDAAADIGLGLEAGLTKINNVFHFVCIAVIIDPAGSKHIGVSGKVALPKKVSDHVNSGGEFGKLIRAYREELPNDSNLIPWIDRLINRKYDFTEAINNAFIALSADNSL